MKQPRPHQLDFAHFHRRTGPHSDKLKGLLGSVAFHGMGLGKTLEGLWEARALMGNLRRAGVLAPKFMVICPKSAVPTWQVECYNECRDLVGDMIIVPYSQLHHAIKKLKYIDLRMIIFDESHKLKGTDTDRVKQLAAFMHEVGTINNQFSGGRIIMATGTPLPNHAAELYTSWALCGSRHPVEAAERLVDEKRITNWKSTFANKIDINWVIGKNKPKSQQRMGHASKLEGLKNEEMLWQLLNPIVHYVPVDKASLPPFTMQTINLNLPDDTLLKNADIDRPEAYMALVERIARAKTPYLIDWVKTFIEGTKEQLIVFSMTRHPVDKLKEMYPKHVRMIVGSGEGSSAKERAQNLADFQQGKFQILAMTYAAGSESLNCQNCMYSLYSGYPWNAAALDQAMARTYRTGQQRPTFHYFLTSGENDQHILGLVNSKRETTQRVERLLLQGSQNITEKSSENNNNNLLARYL